MFLKIAAILSVLINPINSALYPVDEVCGSHSYSYTCGCQEGWLGTNCDLECPKYNNVICNSGDCLLDNNMAICDCSNTDFIGISCSEKNCGNGFWETDHCVCFPPANGLRCDECNSPYVKSVDTCILHCENDGTYDDEKQRCICPEQYSGVECEKHENDFLSHIENNMPLVLGLSIPGVLILASIGVYCCCCKKKKKQIDIETDVDIDDIS